MKHQFHGAKGTSEYKFHFTDYTACKRLHNYEALFINDTEIIKNATNYDWIEYDGTSIPDNPDIDIIYKKNKFKWLLFKNKKRRKFYKKLLT